MFNLRSAIKIEDGEILESNPFIKIEREGDAGIAAGIQTKQESKVSKTKRKGATAFRRWRGPRAATKYNHKQHLQDPLIQYVAQRRSRSESRHEEKTLFSYNDDNLMLLEAFLPETTALSDDDHETNGDHPYAVTKEDFDKYFVGYSFDETSASAGDQAFSVDRHLDDYDSINDTCYGITYSEASLAKDCFEYQMAVAPRSLDEAELVKSGFSEPKVDLIGLGSQDGLVHPSRRAHLLACANDLLPVISEESVKPQRITGANQEPLPPKKNRLGLQLGTAGNTACTNVLHGRTDLHVIRSRDHVPFIFSKPNSMPPTRFEYSDLIIPTEPLPEDLPCHNGAPLACEFPQVEYQETDKENNLVKCIDGE